MHNKVLAGVVIAGAILTPIQYNLNHYHEPIHTRTITRTVVKVVHTLPKCKTEDPINDCVGDSSVYGDGGGIPFVHYHHKMYYFAGND